MIRHATHADIATMLELGEAMHDESRFVSVAWNTEKVGRLITWLIDTDDGLALVAERDGVIVGGFLGVVTEHYFSTDKMAQDFALFVSPDRRGGLAGAQMLTHFIKWARARGVPDEWIQVGVTTGVDIEKTSRLCKAVGFQPAGYLFALKEASPCA